MPETPCCPPLATARLTADEAGELARVFKALSDPVRLQILSALVTAERAICACDFVAMTGKSQPTVSHHLKVLRSVGLVATERRGTWVWYSLEVGRLQEVRRVLDLETVNV